SGFRVCSVDERVFSGARESFRIPDHTPHSVAPLIFNVAAPSTGALTLKLCGSRATESVSAGALTLKLCTYTTECFSWSPHTEAWGADQTHGGLQ
ncbi:hypothetical protein KUCAC02_006965, partial [Chaenocephalus aceratus]